jgi:hypothetical protein
MPSGEPRISFPNLLLFHDSALAIGSLDSLTRPSRFRRKMPTYKSVRVAATYSGEKYEQRFLPVTRYPDPRHIVAGTVRFQSQSLCRLFVPQ